MTLVNKRKAIIELLGKVKDIELLDQVENLLKKTDNSIDAEDPEVNFNADKRIVYDEWEQRRTENMNAFLEDIWL